MERTQALAELEHQLHNCSLRCFSNALNRSINPIEPRQSKPVVRDDKKKNAMMIGGRAQLFVGLNNTRTMLRNVSTINSQGLERDDLPVFLTDLPAPEK